MAFATWGGFANTAEILNYWRCSLSSACQAVLRFYWMHNVKAALILTQRQSFFFVMSGRKGKDLKVQPQHLTWLAAALRRSSALLGLAAVRGAVSTCRSLHQNVQETGFYPGKHTAVATPCSPQGKLCLPKLSQDGWLWKQQWVKLRLVLMFSMRRVAWLQGHQGRWHWGRCRTLGMNFSYG